MGERPFDPYDPWSGGMGSLVAEEQYEYPQGTLPGSGEPAKPPRDVMGALAQTWPARVARDIWGGLTLPGDVYSGKVAVTGEDGRTSPEVIKRAADLAGTVTGGSYARPAMKDASGMGIRAYHSSPHDFERFDLSKIGTGEGAQVYGHGLYFAENPKVSGQGGEYWEQFRHKFGSNEGAAASLLKEHGFDRQKALKVLNQEIEQARELPTDKMFGEYAKQSHIDQLMARKALLESDKPVGPRTYEVEIKAAPEQFLDWDKPLKDQPVAETVRELVSPDLRKTFDYNVDKGNVTGANVYNNYVPNQSFVVRKSVSDPYQPTGVKTLDEALALAGGDPSLVRIINNPDRNIGSQRLAEAGIPGIKYLDQGSRVAVDFHTMKDGDKFFAANYDKAKQSPAFDTREDAQRWINAEKAKRQTNNYVVFDDKLVEIMKKYGIAGLTAGGIGSLAAPDLYATDQGRM